jgi:hypothetical protein
MSNKALFKPFIHKTLGPLSLDHAIDSGNPLNTTIKEFEFDSDAEDQPRLDRALSLGCCVAQTWEDFLEERRTQAQQTIHRRFHVILDKVPNIDDISCIAHIQELVRKQIRVVEVQDAVARLFASLFYVEPDNSIAKPLDGRVLVLSK